MTEKFNLNHRNENSRFFCFDRQPGTLLRPVFLNEQSKQPLDIVHDSLKPPLPIRIRNLHSGNPYLLPCKEEKRRRKERFKDLNE